MLFGFHLSTPTQTLNEDYEPTALKTLKPTVHSCRTLFNGSGWVKQIGFLG